MIEIISKKFKPTDTDQRFMDWCAEVERDEPKTWKGHTIEDIVVMEYNEFIKDLKSGEDARKNLIHLSTALLKMWTSIYCTLKNVEKIRCWGLIRISQMQTFQI